MVDKGYFWLRMTTHTCGMCDGLGRIEHTPSADCPDYEVTCPACGGEGYVVEEVEELVEYQEEAV